MRSVLIGGIGIFLTAAALLGGCGPSAEQETAAPNPLATPAAEMAGTASTRASSTETFVVRVTMSETIETDASRIALRRAVHPLVRQFARTTEREGQAAARELTRLARAAQSPPPTELDAEARAAIEGVRSADARNFDAHYLDAVIAARTTSIEELERYAQTGANDELRDWAADALPMLRARLQEADTLRQSVNVGAAGGGGAGGLSP